MHASTSLTHATPKRGARRPLARRIIATITAAFLLFGRPAIGQPAAAPDPLKYFAETMLRMLERAKLDPPAQNFDARGYKITLLERVYADPDLDHIVFAFALVLAADHMPFLLEADAIEVTYRRAAGNKGPGPDLVLKSWSGGAHCCSTFYAFQLEDARFAVQTIDTHDGEGEVVPDKAGHAVGFKFADANFAYWNTAFAFSPMPYVMLKWSGGRYVADVAAMRKPAPSADEFASMRKGVAAALAEWRGPYVPVDDKDSIDAGQPRGGIDKPAPPPVLWDKLLDLIYSGHAQLAVRLFDGVWPKTVAGKAAFWRDFTRQLRQGDIWRKFGLERALGAQPVFAHTPR